jgi:hypothetical protein
MLAKVPMLYVIPRYAEDTRRGIEVCLRSSLVVPALELLYSGIDVLGFLASANPKADRRSFVAWADSYLDGFLKKKGIGGLDLYAARCGILHTGMAPSELVDQKRARELWYRFRGVSYINLIVNTPNPPVLLDVEEMASAFFSGTQEFLKKVGEDAALGKRAQKKAERFFRPGELLGPIA